MTATLSLADARYATPEERTRFWNQLLDNARTFPGVTSAGLISNIPLSGNVSSGSYSIDGYTPGSGEAAPHGRQEVVGGDYFKAMQIPLRRRTNVRRARWTRSSASVVIIDEFLAQRYFRSRSRLAGQIRRGGPDSPAITIVGVVGTINAIDLANRSTKNGSTTRQPDHDRRWRWCSRRGSSHRTVVTRCGGGRSGSITEQPVAAVRTMDDGWRSRSSTASAHGPLRGLRLVALVLAASALTVSWRLACATDREMGIRQALGADVRAILSLVLVQGLRRVAFGIAAGLAGALALSQLLRSQLYGVLPTDPSVAATATLLRWP